MCVCVYIYIRYDDIRSERGHMKVTSKFNKVNYNVARLKAKRCS